MIKSQLSMFNLPNLFTMANMLCGIFSILLSLHGRIDLAPYPIFLGLLFDFFDGFIARLLKIQGELGKQLDSLADLITFGLAPGMMMLVLLCYGVAYFENPSMWSIVPQNYQLKMMWFAWFEDLIHFKNVSYIPLVALYVPLMSMLRLAKFNIDQRQSDRFIGLPTPANTLFFSAIPLLFFSEFDPYSFQRLLIEGIVHPYFLLTLILLMSTLLISEIPLFALKFKHFKWKENEVRWTFLITCLIICLLLRFWSIPIVVILYFILSIVDNLLNKQPNEI